MYVIFGENVVAVGIDRIVDPPNAGRTTRTFGFCVQSILVAESGEIERVVCETGGIGGVGAAGVVGLIDAFIREGWGGEEQSEGGEGESDELGEVSRHGGCLIVDAK